MSNSLKLKASKACIIHGLGVDTKKLKPASKKVKNNRVILVSRMLYEKGIKEVVEASKVLKMKGYHADFFLIGDTDSLNPSAIPIQKILEWEKSGLISYLGYEQQKSKIYSNVSLVCLPSYREGFPMVLMEAASFGLPVITTKVPGCEDAVVDQHTGLIVPAKDSIALAKAIGFTHRP